MPDREPRSGERHALLAHRGAWSCSGCLGGATDEAFRKTGPRKDVLRAYFEVDFAENTTKKAMAIRKSRDLSSVLGRPEEVTMGESETALRVFCSKRV